MFKMRPDKPEPLPVMGKEGAEAGELDRAPATMTAMMTEGVHRRALLASRCARTRGARPRPPPPDGFAVASAAVLRPAGFRSHFYFYNIFQRLAALRFPCV